MCVCVRACIDQSQVHLEDTADKAADSLTLRHTLYLNIITARRHIHTSCYIPPWPGAFSRAFLLLLFTFFFFFPLFRFVVVTSAWQKGCYFVAGALNRLIRKTQRELNLWLLSSFSSLMKEERCVGCRYRRHLPLCAWCWDKAQKRLRRRHNGINDSTTQFNCTGI